MKKDKLGQESFHPREGYPTEMGISKRLWIATMAMQGMITALTEFRLDMLDGKTIIQNRPKDVSELAFLYADALLEKEKGEEDE